jgi:outer membrane lipoprotein SlyB
MRKPIVSIAIATLLLTLPVIGSAKGCLKGAAVGGVVGHVAGHHTVVGAAAGCVIEHHREKVKEKEAIKNEKKEAGKSV